MQPKNIMQGKVKRNLREFGLIARHTNFHDHNSGVQSSDPPCSEQ